MPHTGLTVFALIVGVLLKGFYESFVLTVVILTIVKNTLGTVLRKLRLKYLLKTRGDPDSMVPPILCIRMEVQAT